MFRKHLHNFRGRKVVLPFFAVVAVVKNRSVVGLAGAPTVTLSGPSHSSSVPRLFSGSDDGSTLTSTFHPVPGSLAALPDYEHMTNPPPPPSWHFSITAAVSYMVQGNFPSPDSLDFRKRP